MGEWREGRLGSVIELKRGYDLPAKDRSSGSIPLVSSAGVSDYVEKAMVQGPGVVTGRYGTLGEVFYLDQPFWPLNTTLYVKDFKGNNPRFVSYFLRTIDFLAHSDKAAVPGLNRNHLHESPVRFPKDAAEQLAIANVLSSLDDKIELNRRMNATLEGMAQAIFRDWFVDFGPVRRKLAGATDPVAILGGLIPNPAKAAPLAALFPEILGDDGSPVGWEKRSIYDYADVIYGAPFSSSKFNSSGVGRPLARIRDLPNHAGGHWTDEVHAKEHLIRAGDLVVGMDGEFRAYIWHGEETLMNQRVCSFVPKASDKRGFVYFGIKPWLADYEGSAIGTTVIHLGKKDIDRFELTSPNDSVLAWFGTIVEPLLNRIVASGTENRTLAETRDYLLPRLMSGKVRVADAERMAG